MFHIKGKRYFSGKIGLFVLTIGIVVGLGWNEWGTVSAEKQKDLKKNFRVAPAVRESVNIEANASPWIKLRQGKAIETDYVGSERTVKRFESGELRPTALAATDFDADGFPDLVSGYAAGNGGVLTFHKGSKEAFAPEDPAVLEGIRNGDFPVSFEKEARTVDLPVTPDFIAAGKFYPGSTLDLAVGARSSNLLLILRPGKDGEFEITGRISMPGNLTGLAAASLSLSKPYSGIAAAYQNDTDCGIAVFDGAAALDSKSFFKVKTTAPVDSMILTNPDGSTTDKDLFFTAGGELQRIGRLAAGAGEPVRIPLPVTVSDLAAGEFIRDRRAKTELAVLGDDGSVYILQNGALDRRPFTEKEMRDNFARFGRGRRQIVDSTDQENALANDWTIAEQQNLGVFAKGGGAARLTKAYVTGNETEDLMVVNPVENKIQVLFREPVYGTDRAAFTGETRVENLSFPGEIAAVQPVRLNVMGQQGIAVLEKGNLEPTPVMFVPAASFSVNSATDAVDVSPGNGICATAGAVCTLRAAVMEANALAGADLITFVGSSTHQLTVGSFNENAGAGGDLDVLQSLTITGNGSANTIVQAGTNTLNAIDKDLSINPNFNSAFATAMSGIRFQFGRNQGSYSGDGFAGAFDWEASGTGTLTVSNCIVSDSRALDGDGGGIALTNSNAGNGSFTGTALTVTNNQPSRIGLSSSFGGGIFVGTTTPVFLTNVTINNNSVNGSGGQGQGGGIFAFGPSGGGGSSFLTTSTVSNNLAPSDAGGMYATQRFDINGPTTISGNSSGRFGGGLFYNHGNVTSTISKATITGNTATTQGGGIYLGSSPTANLLNVSFSRIVGNTGGGFTGLAADAGTATATNNWWGCNTGAAAPCNTAGAITTGTVTATPYLQLRLSASPTTVVTGQPSALTASFLQNSAGSSIAASNLNVLIGLPVSWSGTGGTVSFAGGNGGGSLLDSSIQATATAAATFTAATIGAKSASATVDSGQATANLTVNKASTTASITGQSQTATTTLQSFTVFYLISVTAPGGGTPTGNVTVTDGVNSCTATVAAGQCTLTLTTVGNRTLTATYGGNADYNGSPASPGASHTVNSATAAQVSIGGRVTTADGRGIFRVRIALAGPNGQIRTATTNSFGYFRFDGVESGEIYTLSAAHREYVFAPQLVNVGDEITDLIFAALN
ncbi:MAG: Ig-like domain repeat protein [Acidobacteria bacterium]|nr:Ig-like domain repeat protein [Acidobacteriota bacterium]